MIPGLIDMHWHSAFNSISVADGLTRTSLTTF